MTPEIAALSFPSDTWDPTINRITDTVRHLERLRLSLAGRVPRQDVFSTEPGYRAGISKEVMR